MGPLPWMRCTKEVDLGGHYLPTIYAMQFHFLRYVYALETITLHPLGGQKIGNGR